MPHSSKLRSVVRGVGAYLPEKILTNKELAELVDTSDEWIVQRTGIHERHIAAKDETTSMLGAHAARASLTEAQFFFFWKKIILSGNLN